MKKLILPLLSLLILLSHADARFWTNRDGRNFEGELVEVKDNAVTIRRATDRRKFTMPITNLSNADQDYLNKLQENKDVENVNDSLPKTKADLEKWIIGTEWEIDDTIDGEKIKYIRRFGNKRALGFKKPNQKKFGWNPNSKYSVLSPNTIEFGVKKRVAVFDSKYKKFITNLI